MNTLTSAQLSKNRLFYGLNAAILLFGLTLLIILERRVVSDRHAVFENARELIGAERILRTPDDPNVSFAAIESIASSIRKNPFIRDLCVSKITRRRGEIFIHPFYLGGMPPDKAPDLRRFSRLNLGDPSRILGHLYILPNNRVIYGVRAAAAAFALLLVLTLVSGARRVRAQEKVISATTVELEEKGRELIRLERLALAGQLSANILHDIKKPVLNIRQEVRDLEQAAEKVNLGMTCSNILEQVDLFFNILRDLGLERFVKAREGGGEFLDVNEILDRSLRLVRYERGGVAVESRLAAALPLVFAEPSPLIQVFSNIILNAYQAMKGRGTLTLATTAASDGVSIIISDTGPGIRPDLVPRLFTPFFTTRPKAGPGEEEGTGLGLYISRNILDRLNGTITVESVPGQGAAFHITLPAARDARPDSQERRPNP